MRLPEFTAEASLGKIRESYVLTSKTAAETGRVLPQQWGESQDLRVCRTICWGVIGSRGFPSIMCYTLCPPGVGHSHKGAGGFTAY